MHQVEKRYLKVFQKHSFADELYTLYWRALCDFAPQKGEIFNVVCLQGTVEYVAHTVFNEGLLLDFGVGEPVEAVPSKMVMETVVGLEFGFKHRFDVEEIFEQMEGAEHLTEIENFTIGGRRWSSTMGWSGRK